MRIYVRTSHLRITRAHRKHAHAQGEMKLTLSRSFPRSPIYELSAVKLKPQYKETAFTLGLRRRPSLVHSQRSLRTTGYYAACQVCHSGRWVGREERHGGSLYWKGVASKRNGESIDGL